MDLLGKAKRVRIYVNEDDHIGHEAAHVAVLEFLRQESAAGAIVLRAIEGLSESGQIQTTRLVDAAARLPLVIEWIDQPATVERLLPRLKELLPSGLVTLDETEVVMHAPAPARDVAPGLTAGKVMAREVSTVSPDTPARQVVELLLEKGHRAVPVIDGASRPIGMITNSDLVTRGGLGARVELLPRLETPAVHAELERLAVDQKTAREIMSHNPVTVPVSATLPQVAEVMARRRLKRLPVVDADGTLVGIISRVDLLRTVAGGAENDWPAPALTGLNGDTPISRIVRRDVAAVHAGTPLAQVMQAVVSTRLNRAIVVDADRHVVGIVSDAELLDRVTPALHASALRTLMHRLPFAHPNPEELEAEQHAGAQTAAGLMHTDVPTAPAEMPLGEAIALMLPGAHKVIAVVDGDRRLVGIVDRADILRGLALPN
jgi:CBS domain-containing protein